MAYYCGMAFGRKIINRPLTHLSPNKTWEGFVGAMICTVTIAYYFSPYLIKNDWFICPASSLAQGNTCTHLADFDKANFTVCFFVSNVLLSSFHSITFPDSCSSNCIIFSSWCLSPSAN